MPSNLLHLYQVLPSRLKSVAASLWGYYLRSWRYGADTEQLVAQALDREHWDSNRWKTWQEEQLVRILNRAATRVPYYRDHWAERRRKGDYASWEYLENWPILTKELLRIHSRALIADDCNTNTMFHEHTSGTTGTPLDIWWSRLTVRSWYALLEARCRRWNELSLCDRWAMVGGQLITSVSQQRPPFWVWNAAFKQLYMSSYHLAPSFIHHYLDALQNYAVKYIFGYSSSLYLLAQEALRLGRTDLRMAVVLTNAEPLLSYQRNTISEAFHCPVRETYGMAEIVGAASECAHGKLHLWPEVGWIEVLENDRPVANGNAADFVCTSLLNVDMPLIRYRVGDRGSLEVGGSTCFCGRNLPTLGSVEGRCDDMVYAADGRPIGRLDPVFKGDLPLREAQIIQEKLDLFRVRYVPSGDLTPENEQVMVKRLQERVGPVEVVLEPVSSIPRTANGKFRAVLCKLTPSDKKLVNADA